jgi:23S rRNA pseudouridine955/2504/2580 synthase
VRYLDVEESGQRIDNYLARELKSVPKSRIYRMLRRGEVRVNGGRVRPTYRLAAGDRVRIPPVMAADRAVVVPPAALGARLEATILFEDEALIVIDKPAGVAVHGGSGLSGGVVEALRARRPDAFLELAHRLDRDTSGCLVLAKSRAALQVLHAALREGAMHKRYQLLVAGRWPRGRRSVQLRLERYVMANGERRVRVASAGKPARTDFAVRAELTGATWLEANLHTGRTHQIRVHAAASGCPVLGEAKYETESSQRLSAATGIQRLCLHAASIAFPWQGTRMRIDAPLPDAFETAWRRLTAAGD